MSKANKGNGNANGNAKNKGGGNAKGKGKGKRKPKYFTSVGNRDFTWEEAGKLTENDRKYLLRELNPKPRSDALQFKHIEDKLSGNLQSIDTFFNATNKPSKRTEKRAATEDTLTSSNVKKQKQSTLFDNGITEKRAATEDTLTNSNVKKQKQTAPLDGENVKKQKQPTLFDLVEDSTNSSEPTAKKPKVSVAVKEVSTETKKQTTPLDGNKVKEQTVLLDKNENRTNSSKPIAKKAKKQKLDVVESPVDKEASSEAKKAKKQKLDVVEASGDNKANKKAPIVVKQTINEVKKQKTLLDKNENRTNSSKELHIVSLEDIDDLIGQRVNTVAVIVSIVGHEDENDDSDEDFESDGEEFESDDEEFESKENTRLLAEELIVVDKSFEQVTVKLMGKHTSNFLAKEEQAVMLKNVLIQEDGGQIILFADDKCTIHSTPSKLTNDLEAWFDSATDSNALIDKCEEMMDTQAPVQEEATDLDESCDLNEASSENRKDSSGDNKTCDVNGQTCNFDFRSKADCSKFDLIVKERGKEARKAFEFGVGLPIKENTRIIEAGVYTIGYNDVFGFPDYTMQDLTNYTPIGYRKSHCFRVDKENHVGNEEQYSERCNSYAYNGAYDRGHVACAADNSSDAIDYRSTFIHSNVFPMHKKLNRKAWYLIEKYIRRIVSKEGTYVCTGAFFDDTEETRYLNGGTAVVPSYCFKSVLIKTDDGYLAKSWLLPNENVKFRDLHRYVTSVGIIEERAKIKLFPNVKLDIIKELTPEQFVDDVLTKALTREVVEKWYRKHSEDSLGANTMAKQLRLLSLVNRRCCICDASEHSGKQWHGTTENPKTWLCYDDYKRACRLGFEKKEHFTTENIEKVRQNYLEDPESMLRFKKSTKNTRCCICHATEHNSKSWYGTAENPKTWLCYDDWKRARRLGFEDQKDRTTENVEKMRQDYLEDPESVLRFEKSTENTRCCICDAIKHNSKKWYSTTETPKRWLCTDDYNRARRLDFTKVADFTTENIEKVRQNYLEDPESGPHLEGAPKPRSGCRKATVDTRCCICDASEHGGKHWYGTSENPKTWLCKDDFNRACRIVGSKQRKLMTTENIEKVRQNYLREQA